MLIGSHVGMKGHVSRICQRSIILWSEYFYGVHWRTTEYKKKKD